MLLLTLLVSCCLLTQSSAQDSADTYVNNVAPGNHPDPGVLPVQVDGLWYVATTSGDAADAFPIMSSPDLVTWKAAGYIFPKDKHPKWATGNFWAPEIHQISADQYNVYFVALNGKKPMCVGVATAAHPTGPYTATDACLVEDDTMGQIDPHFFKDTDGTNYVVWKTDGNAVGKPTPIWIQELDSKGTALVGKAVMAIEDTLAFEGGITEAPWLIKRNSTYYLFYSANSYATSRYCVSVARSTHIFGPYDKLNVPVLASLDGSKFAGPGHCSVLTPMSAGGTSPYKNWYIVYHAWLSDSINKGDRLLMVDELLWTTNDDTAWPYMNGDTSTSPSSHPEPYPN